MKLTQKIKQGKCKIQKAAISGCDVIIGCLGWAMILSGLYVTLVIRAMSQTGESIEELKQTEGDE